VRAVPPNTPSRRGGKGFVGAAHGRAPGSDAHPGQSGTAAITTQAYSRTPLRNDDAVSSSRLLLTSVAEPGNQFPGGADHQSLHDSPSRLPRKGEVLEVRECLGWEISMNLGRKASPRSPIPAPIPEGNGEDDHHRDPRNRGNDDAKLERCWFVTELHVMTSGGQRHAA
jgi:hypothetical protein